MIMKPLNSQNRTFTMTMKPPNSRNRTFTMTMKPPNSRNDLIGYLIMVIGYWLWVIEKLA